MIQNDDETLYLGTAPMYAYDYSASMWRKLACDASGNIVNTAPSNQSQSFTPSQSGQTVQSGPAEMVGIVNNTTSVIEVLDNTTVITVVLPQTQLIVPITISNDLVIRSVSLVATDKVSVIWRNL